MKYELGLKELSWRSAKSKIGCASHSLMLSVSLG